MRTVVCGIVAGSVLVVGARVDSSTSVVVVTIGVVGARVDSSTSVVVVIIGVFVNVAKPDPSVLNPDPSVVKPDPSVVAGVVPVSDCPSA